MSVVGQLFKPLAKTLHWRPLIAAAIAALAIAWTSTTQPAETGFRLPPVRLGVLALAIWAAFLFDDNAAPVTNPAAQPIRLRRVLKATYGYLAISAVLIAVLLIASSGMDLIWTIPEPSLDPAAVDFKSFPAGRVALEAATLSAFALATAAFLSHRDEDQPGRISSVILLGACLVSALVPEAYQPWADPSDQRWTTGANWWWTALVAFMGVALIFSWEARQRVPGTLRRLARRIVSVHPS